MPEVSKALLRWQGRGESKGPRAYFSRLLRGGNPAVQPGAAVPVETTVRERTGIRCRKCRKRCFGGRAGWNRRCRGLIFTGSSGVGIRPSSQERQFPLTVHRSPLTAFMSIIASDIRRGMAIIFNGEPCRVLEFHHHTPGNLRAMVQAKLRRLRTGTQVEHRFRSTDTVDVAELMTHELDFMYK